MSGTTSDFDVNAQARTETGKGAMRRLRATGMVPGVMYGAGRDPQNIIVKGNELRKQLENEAFFSHILTVNVGSEKVQAVVKDMQRHPASAEVMHVDFLRVKATEALTMRVPLHFINEDDAPGVTFGGVFSHMMNDVEISCLPRDLPEYIEVDVAAMELGDSLNMSSLVMPEGVSLTVDVSDPDQDHMLVSLQKPMELDLGEDEGEEGEVAAGDVPTTSEDAGGDDESSEES